MIQLTVGLAVSVAVLAGQAPQNTTSGNYTGLGRTVRAKAPYEMKAFQPVSPKVAGRADESWPGLERGPCGMPIIAAKADIDPKIIVPIPDDAKREARIRVAEPGPCGAMLSNAGRK